VQLEPAYVLSRRPYANSSLLIELFGAVSGRISVIARGARSQAGRRGGHLQPFVPLEAAWQGRGSVKTLTRGEAAGLPLLQHGEVLFFGYYLNELLLRLLPRGDGSTELFGLYVNTLSDLSEQGGDERLLRGFEVRLLQILGYQLGLSLTVEGEPVQAEMVYHYTLDEGPVRADSGQGLVSGALLLALDGNLPLNEARLAEARPFMRRIMRHYLGDKPLKSRELFRALQRRTS
jgi:DNA repair protein RecO (recombination protein O)